MSKVRPRPPRPWRPSRPYRFLLRLYYVVQSSYCVHPIFGGRSGNVAGVMGVLGICGADNQPVLLKARIGYDKNKKRITDRIRQKIRIYVKLVLPRNVANGSTNFTLHGTALPLIQTRRGAASLA